jgi:signal transduction histidine kinase
MISHHASPGRTARNLLLSKHADLLQNKQLPELLEALPYVAAILNFDRQIVFSNKSLLTFLGIENVERLIGKRPGEAMHCINSNNMDAGCGTSENCQVCGAANTIIRCQETGKTARDECRIRTVFNGFEDWLDLEVTASPFGFNDENYIIFTARDISSEKRKESLERIFFHDVINTAGTLQGLVDVLRQANDPERTSQFIDLLAEVSKSLIEEIMNQKSLLDAENGELVVKNHTFYLQETVNSIVKEYRKHELARNKKIIFDANLCEITLYADPVLLKRVVSNMIKNALEAIDVEDKVIVGCQLSEDNAAIYVHNQSYIPDDTQKQIFQRSFSTKGKGRGLGTYSMKLLSEKYLGGKVYFTSNKKEGTYFYLRLPIQATEL